MPISPSPRRGAKPPPPAPARSYWPVILLIIGVAALAVAIGALPASILTHFLPATVRAQDFSGSLWHGSAGKITVNARDAGALEWRLHPAALLQLHVAADLHWVKGGFVLDGSAEVHRDSILASNIQGSGPIEDLSDLGVAAGWHGIAKVQIKELKALVSGPFVTVQSAIGDIEVSGLTAMQVAGGADLGGYSLHFADPTLSADSEATAQLADTGGPLAVDAEIHFSGKERRGMLSGTLKERAGAPAALRSQLDMLAQLHARDGEGRVPVDLEFTL